MTLGGLEPPTSGLGNRCSIHLSYRAATFELNNSSKRMGAAFDPHLTLI